MKDYNFFSQYVYVKSVFPIKKLILPLIYVLLFLAIANIYLMMEDEKSELQAIYDANETLINSNEFRDSFSESQQLMLDVEALNAIYQESAMFLYMTPVAFPVTDSLTTSILESIPRNVSFMNYEINERGVEVSGNSTDYSYIAEFEYNLRQLDLFNHIFVNVISSEEGVYTFSISMEFGGDLSD